MVQGKSFCGLSCPGSFNPLTGGDNQMQNGSMQNGKTVLHAAISGWS